MHYCTECSNDIAARRHFDRHGLHGNPTLGGCGYYSTYGLSKIDTQMFNLRRQWISYVLYDGDRVVAWYDSQRQSWEFPTFGIIVEEVWVTDSIEELA